MRIGIITGKDDEVSLNNEINKLVPKKFYQNGNVHTDIALAFLMKERFVGFQVDIITPKELTNQRLKKNDINFIIGYDIINAINDDPHVKKFAGQKGLEKLDKIAFITKIISSQKIPNMSDDCNYCKFYHILEIKMIIFFLP